MNKQLAMTSTGPFASGNNSDFPRLSDSKALSALVKSLNAMKPMEKAS